MSEIKPIPQRANANRHTQRGMQALETSIATDGWIGAITVAADGETFDGSARVEKTAENGMLDDAIVLDIDGTKPVILRRVDIPSATDPRAVRLGVAANRVAALNLEWEPDVLAGILESGVDLGALFTADEWADVALPALPETGNGGDDFDATPEDGPTRTQVGELWGIGGVHRLLVGDCTDPANVARLMGGERAQGVFTSPPYAEQRKEQYGGIPEDEYLTWFSGVQEQIAKYLAPNGSFFLNIKEHSEDVIRSVYVHELVVTMVREWEWAYIDEFCWERVGIPGDPVRMGKFKNQWEPVFWFSKTNRPRFRPQRVMHASDDTILDTNYQPTLGKSQGTGRNVLGTRLQGKGMAYPGNRLRGGNAEALGHAAAFPLSLADFFIEVYSDPGDIWYEPFGGSGTVLISAHRLDRVARVCELLPRYADVILRRAEAEGLEVTRIDG